ncbi:plastocyanin/azurin family copper-binding protein [Amycolatopsis sp. NPDC059657]|uniref:cupredoxin domain-containing protein n=1 Tax=Amycolatopsis sp. NPDC059657 TaxID=3346899 RepID=UPI00366CEAFA
MSRVLLAGFLVLAGLFLPVPSASAATRQVMMQGYAYAPSALTISVGDTVTWMQHDEAPHDVVTTSAPAAFRSPKLTQGQSWSYTFRTPGTYSYYCSVHPDMRAQIVVQAPPSTPVSSPKPAPTTKPSTKTSPSVSSAVVAPSTVDSPTSSPPPPSETQIAAPPVAQQAAATLDPMLLVAGLVTGIAVLCLLLLSARRE